MNLYVGNLSFDSSEAELENAFAQFGDINSVSIVKDRDTGRSRGFGFVEMQSREAGMAAIESLNLSKIGGRAITVNEARPRTNNGGGGGGGGGRGGYNRR